jgi:hypothetical protein
MDSSGGTDSCLGYKCPEKSIGKHYIFVGIRDPFFKEALLRAHAYRNRKRI